MATVNLPLTTLSYEAWGQQVNLLFPTQYVVTAQTNTPLITQVGTPGQQGIGLTITKNQGTGIDHVALYQNDVPVALAWTDLMGTCTLFVPSGTYTLEVNGSTWHQTFPNYILASGITPNYTTISGGQPITTYSDTWVYPNLTTYRIRGTLVDEHSVPLNQATLLISSNTTVMTYYLTDATGDYDFALPTGTFNVHLSALGYGVKVYRDLTFTGNMGFFSTLAQLDPNFNLGGDWLWTLI